MANRLGKYLASWLFACLLVGPVVLAAYQPGAQEFYPFYVPEEFNSLDEVAGLKSIAPLRGTSGSEQAFNFARDWLGADEIGAAAFSGVLYSVSQLDPAFSDGQLCGIAGWRCDSDRYKSLVSFSQALGINPDSSKTQFLFIAHELTTELNNTKTGLNNGGQQQAWKASLSGSSNLETAVSQFSNYLMSPSSGAQAAAMTIYETYHPNVVEDSSFDAIEPAPPPSAVDPTPSPPPQTTTPSPPPQSNTSQQPSRPTSDCQAGLENGYIASLNDSDANGKYIVSARIIVWSKDGSPYFNSVLVHRCIKQSVESLFRDFNSAHKTSGYQLVGWGWRSHQSQINLRRINGCPDIYKSPSGSCKTPTAIPGRSNHQNGHAIDFRRVIQSQSSVSTATYSLCPQGKSGCAPFAWLAANAGRYGFKNLISDREPWHFSLNGR